MIESLLPITALVAIIVFIAREFLEGLRRWNERDRRKRSIQKLAAINMERNHWAAKSLKSAISKFQDAIEGDARVKLLSDESSHLTIEHYNYETEGVSAHGLPPIDFSFLEENLREFAILDEASFTDAISAYDALLELEHVRNSLIKNISILNGQNDSEFPHHVFLSSFIDFATIEIEDCISDMSKFYLKCTGNTLNDNFRVR